VCEMDLGKFNESVVREALLQRPEGNAVRCMTCMHQCFIREGKTGVCGTRVNDRGLIKTLTYGNVSSISNNPIEKKPFFHFAPGTTALTVGSWGCNASCPFCQNYDISKAAPTPDRTRYVGPEEFVAMAVDRGSQGVSISFSEAATLMLEWNLDVFEIARKEGLYTTIVTNGYMTMEALDLMIGAGLDAANVDLKGCEPLVSRVCGIGLLPVMQNVSHMIERGVHVELTTLVVPGLSDDNDCLRYLAEWIRDATGPKTPWHINRYYPAYKYEAPATSLKTLEQARTIAQDTGLEFVYVGNTGIRGYEDTRCPACGALCYRRSAFSSHNRATSHDGLCSVCGYDLGIRQGADRKTVGQGQGKGNTRR
jgi:pyruvate formate lyase activating enzyme